MDIYRKIKEKSKKALHWTTFFMAFPNFAIVQNLSFFFLLLFGYRANKLPFKQFSVNGVMGTGSVLFILASLISCIGAGFNVGYDYFLYSLTLFPNYFYWSSLIIFVGNLAFKVTTLEEIARFTFYGLICFILARYVAAPLLSYIPIYRPFPQNAFAFVLILFNPLAISYIHAHYKKTYLTFLFIIGFSIAGFLSGSRSGSLLVLGGGLSVLLLESWERLLTLTLTFLFFIFLVPQFLELESVKETIFSLNERTYQLIYERDEVIASDRSYLTRLAMIEKGLNIFEDFPLTGIGIGNFSRTEYEIDFDFEGSEFVANRAEDLETRTNPHNTYISFLSEGGLILLLPALLLMFYPLFYFVLNFNRISSLAKGLFIGVLYMCIHSFFITGMVNVYGWFLLALCQSYILTTKKEFDEARLLLSQQLRNQFR